MRITYIEDELEVMEFVQKAAKAFEQDPQLRTFTDEDIKPDCLFAVRWGLGDDGVLVFKLHDAFEPTVYGQVIRKDNNGE